MNKVNICLVKRTDRWGYDEYDACVVQAMNEEQAKKVSPHNYEIEDKQNGVLLRNYWNDNLIATLIGINNNKEPKLILSSFNAG